MIAALIISTAVSCIVIELVFSQEIRFMIDCLIFGEQDTIEMLSIFIKKLDSKLTLVGVATVFSEGLKLVEPEKVYLVYIDSSMVAKINKKFHLLKRQCFIHILTDDLKDKKGNELSVVNYMLKSISFNAFKRSIKEMEIFLLRFFLTNQVETGEDCLEISIDRKGLNIFKIKLSDLLYIKSWGNYVHIYDFDGLYTQIRSTLKMCEERLFGANFSRIHNSYIVNHAGISMIKFDKVFLAVDSRIIIPIGDSWKEPFFAKPDIQLIKLNGKLLRSKNS